MIGTSIAGVAMTLAAALLAAPAVAVPHGNTPRSLHVPPPKPPAAATGGASDVGETSAALSGVVNPHGAATSCYFQYGTTTAYGAQTPVAAAGGGAVGIRVSQPVAGLQLGTVYHYRLVAVSANGGTDGQDRTFTTKQIPLRFVLEKSSAPRVFDSPFTIGGTLTGTGAANHQVVMQANPFPYLGAFADIGTPQTTTATGDFSFHVPSISQTTELRVRTLDALPTYSQVVTERVAVRVTLRARATSRRGVVRLTGTVAPAEAGAQVVFQWMRSLRAPVTVASAVVRGGAGGVSHFRAVVDIRRGGLYRALVRVSNGRQVTGSSPTVLLHGSPAVRRPPRARARR